MRVSHPMVFVVGIAAVALFFVAIALHKAWRVLSWPSVRRRREGWLSRVARVESAMRVTEAGDYLLVLDVALAPDDAESYRGMPARVKLRGIARLPQQAVTWMENANELPVRVAPPSSLAVDLRPIVGEEAVAIERAAYLQRGAGHWQPVVSP